MYAVCFDFPGEEGDPKFAGPVGTPFTSLEHAVTFRTEQQAERVLASYLYRDYGTVVEVGE
jgi:hypothetical protein